MITVAFVYRLRDAEGVLLYVGMTGNLANGLRAHIFDKPWFADVARIDLERFASRRAAADAEYQALCSEQPMYNSRRVRAPRFPDGPIADGDLSAQEVAAIFLVTPQTVLGWADRGLFPGYRTASGRRRFRRADVDTFINAQRKVAVP